MEKIRCNLMSFIRNKQNLLLISIMQERIHESALVTHKDYSSLALISSLATPIYSILFILQHRDFALLFYNLHIHVFFFFRIFNNLQL